MTVATLIAKYRIRIEDSGSIVPESELLGYLNEAMYFLINTLDNDYLTELEYVDTDKALTSGVMNITDLTYEVLRGREGIIRVVAESNDCDIIYDLKKIQEFSNYFHSPLEDNPVAYVEANKIKVLPTSLAIANVTYLQVPDDMTAAGDYPLNTSLYDIHLDIAESKWWAKDNKTIRQKTAFDTAIAKIDILNKRKE